MKKEVVTMKSVDCLLIGNNEMSLASYEGKLRYMGTKSGAYRDLNLNFIHYDGQPCSAADVFNLLAPAVYKEPMGDCAFSNTFSATIAYLGSYLHRRGMTFEYVNAFQEQKEELKAMLRNDQILAIAIPTTLYVSVFPILEIIAFVRQYNQTAKILVGGPFIGTQAKTQDEYSLLYTWKTINADIYVNSSQGEAALAAVITALKNHTPLESIPNLYYKKGDGYGRTAAVKENNLLDQNRVDWGLFAGRLGKIAAVRTAISCPFSCAFCGFPEHAGKYQTAGITTIEQELDSLAAAGKISGVYFTDDTFNVPPERFKALLQMMKAKQYPFKWNCNFRCQFIDAETVALMQESGCEGVFLGIESGSQAILDNMNKHASLEKYKEGHRLLKEYGIMTYMSFIVGFPGETAATADETLGFIRETKPDFFRTQLWYCDPFTPIWKEAETYKIKNSQFEWSHATMDAQTACDLIDRNFLTVTDSIWVPQNNFDTVGIYNLLHRGMSLAQIKAFLSGFNQGVKDKLQGGAGKDAGPEAVNIMQSAFAENKQREAVEQR